MKKPAKRKSKKPKLVREFGDTNVGDAGRHALRQVVDALAVLSEEARRRVVYTTAVFYGIIPVEVPATLRPPAKPKPTPALRPTPAPKIAKSV